MEDPARRNVYLICPVRMVTPEEQDYLNAYVETLEWGGATVHFPPRDVDQSNDDGGVRICREHRQAMLTCDEVHVFWNEKSLGSHFDLGMAFMLDHLRREEGYMPIKFVIANQVISRVSEKSFTNVLRSLI